MVQGKTVETAKKIIIDAKNLEREGVFSIVLESIPWQISKLITESIDIPTIGIGAGKYCDGQILVINDMLGLFTDIKPKFMKYFGNIGQDVETALNKYKLEVMKEEYPDRKTSYDYSENDLDQIYEWFESIDLEEEAIKSKN
jgi:3-methyl-2-oxobutanoate hydroxymethyltransferase